MSAHQPLEDLQTFVLLAKNNTAKPLNQADWAEWIEMVDRTAQDGYSLKSVAHSLPTDFRTSYVAIGHATATQLRRMRETLREIRRNHPAGDVSMDIVGDLDEPI